MDDDFRTVTITRIEIERLFRENTSLKGVFQEFRQISEKKGLSYSRKLSIQTWFDAKGNLRQKNYLPTLPEEVKS